ncbi:unnamed protein product [Closterium sp. NIES-53]
MRPCRSVVTVPTAAAVPAAAAVAVPAAAAAAIVAALLPLPSLQPPCLRAYPGSDLPPRRAPFLVAAPCPADAPRPCPTSSGPPLPPLVSAPPHPRAAAPAPPCLAEPPYRTAPPCRVDRAVDFEVWVDDLHLFLHCDSKDGLSLFDLTSGTSTARAADADRTIRSQWTTRDAAACLAVRSHLPSTERAHFSHYKSAKTLYDAVVACYSSPATAALSHLMMLYLFPDLAALATVADLITHLRSDTRYRAALSAESGPESAPCSCRLLSHQTLLRHHRLAHPSLPRPPGSSLYTLTTVSPAVSASGQGATSSQVFAVASRSSRASAPCSCRPLLHETLLWHHRLGHPSLPCLRGMAFRTLAPLQTLHMDVWGPTRVRGQGHERYFLLVIDDYCWATVFPLRRKGEVTEVLIDWIRGAHRQLSERFGSDLPVLCLHPDRGGEFSSDLLRAFCRAEGIRQTFTLPASTQQNGIAECRIGMVMDVARTSMIHAAAPHGLWPFAVQYAAHQINLQPPVSLPETTPTLRWTGKVGDASAFRVWGSRAFVRDTLADKLSSRAVPLTHPGGSSTTTPRVVFCPLRTSCLTNRCLTNVSFPTTLPLSPPQPLFLALGTPPVDPLLPQDPALSGVSQVDHAEPVEVAVDSGAARGAESAGAGPGAFGAIGAASGGAESGGAEPARAESRGSLGVPLRWEPLSPQQLREWYARRCCSAAESAGAGATGGAAGAGTTGGAAGAGGSAGAGASGGAAGAGAARGAAGAGATGGAAGSAWDGRLYLHDLCGRSPFLWPFAVRYAVHHLNLWPHVSLPKTSSTLRWTGKVGDASMFRFYHPTSRRVLPSQDVTFDESVPFYRLFPYRSAPPPPPLLFLAPGPPPVDPLPPQGPAPSGVSQVDPLPGTAPIQGAVVSGAAPGAIQGGTGSGGAEPEGAEPGEAEPPAPGAGVAGDTGAGGAVFPTGAVAFGGVGCDGAGVSGVGGPGAEGAGAARAGVGCTGAGVAGAAGAGAVDPGAGGAGDTSQPSLQPPSPLPAPSPYTENSGGLTERREPAFRPVLPVRTIRRAPRSRPPPVQGKHTMALRPSSVPLRVPLPAPPESSLPEVLDPESDRALAPSPTVARLLNTAVPDPYFESAATSALVAELLDFAAACSLDYATALMAESVSASPPSIRGECALGTKVLEDRQEDFECLVAAVPQAITGPYSSQWREAMDAEMASWKSTGTYVDEVSPPGPNIVDGMWIFRVKRPPGSPPAFKAPYGARGISQQQGVDKFQTFSPSPKMTTLQVLLHVAAQRDYELHSLDFCIAFLQGSLHEEIWLRRPPGFTQWSLRRPVYGPSALRLLVHLATAHSSVYQPLTLSSTFGRVLRRAWGLCLEDGVQLSSLVTQTPPWSSCEAEIYIGVMAAQELRWLTYLLTDLGEQPRWPPVLYVDNKAMIALCQEHRLEHRTKHIALRYFLARELQQRGQLRLAYVATRASTADVFTKALPPIDHQRFATVLGLVPTLPHLLTA